MGMTLGIMAIALAGWAGGPKPQRANVEIEYTVRFVETEGLGWRQAVFTRLTPVTRQGAATVWTASRSVSRQLVDQALADPTARVVQTPRVTAGTGSAAHFSMRSNQHLITQVAWDGQDRPTGTKPETVRTGPVATMVGRKIDQGILVQIVLEDTEVRAVHRVSIGGTTEPKSCPDTKKAAYRQEERAKSPDCRESSIKGSAMDSILRNVEWSYRYSGFGAGLPSIFIPGFPLSTFVGLAAPPDDFDFPAVFLIEERDPKGTISKIQLEGNPTMPAEQIRAKLLSQVGQPIDSRKIAADLKTLTRTRWFSGIQIFYKEPWPRSGEHVLSYLVLEPSKPALSQTEETCPNAAPVAKPAASSDCAACEKDEVIRAHLETAVPAPTACATSTETTSCMKDAEAGTVSIEVPEIASQEVAGEWLIPTDGILLVSFGPHTVADKDGKAVVRERLAIVEAEGVADAVGAARPMSRAPGVLALPRPAVPDAAAGMPRLVPPPGGGALPPLPPMADPNLPVAVPAPPSRSIPQGVHADGRPAELPPLPADELEASPSTDSAEPAPSPQSKKPQPQPQPQREPAKPASPAPATDSQARRTGFTTPARFPAIPAMFVASPTVGLQFLVPIKPISLRLPFNRRLEIEIFGRIVRNPDPIPTKVSDE